VQVDPIKPTLKPTGTKRLKLKYDEPLLNCAFKFNLRSYTPAAAIHAWGRDHHDAMMTDLPGGYDSEYEEEEYGFVGGGGGGAAGGDVAGGPAAAIDLAAPGAEGRAKQP